MKKYFNMLIQTALFSGIDEKELDVMLSCLNAEKKDFSKGEYIFRVGDTTSLMGVVLSGNVMLIQEDVWGRRNIIAKPAVGDVFAEPFAASHGEAMNLSALAENDCVILMLDINKILTVCPSACSHHTKIVKNLVSVLAHKTLILNDKITHMSRKSTKEKLMSYLSSESVRQRRFEFDIPFDRQQLADYLCVERAAMSAELSKLQKEGIISFNKNHFIIHRFSEN